MTTIQNQIQQLLTDLAQTGQGQLQLDIEGTTYLRSFQPHERLIILGGGHVAQQLCRFASALGFFMILVDDRPEFACSARFPDADRILCMDFASALDEIQVTPFDYAVIVTRGHQYDMTCLKYFLALPLLPKYLGMMGSRRRVAGIKEMLVSEGIPQSTLDQIHMPIGLSINAITPEEIAISIAAELVACRRSNFPRHAISPQSDTSKKNPDCSLRSLSTLNRPIPMIHHDIDEKLIAFLRTENRAAALLLVYSTQGSTPAKTGAIMAVNSAMQTAGTIGGGCAEAAALRQARALIGTGTCRTITLAMDADVQENAGMACGGTIRVFLADLSLIPESL